MSTKNVTLHDEDGNVLLPATKTSRVTDANGTNLDTLLQQAGQVKSISVNGTTQTIDANGNVNIASVYTKTETDTMLEGMVICTDDDGSASTASFDAQADTVWNKAQTLSSAQQAQARSNIGAQEALVSGTNIKTINNESILGSGNITISGGGGSGEANVIESISINGTAQAVTNKNVNLTVPTSSTVTAIVTLTEAQYTALATKDSSTLYIITA